MRVPDTWPMALELTLGLHDEAVPARESEFSALVERQSRFVFRVAYALLRNPADSEDVVQETFLKLYRNGAWRRMEDERAFLARTAWRLALNKKRVKQIEAPEATITMTPEQQAITENATAVLHRMIDSLPEELRQPLALSSLEEMSSREIAEVMGLPEGTVRTRLLRARQMLKQKLMPLLGSAR